MNIDAKICNKVLANWIQQYIKRILYHGKVGFSLWMQRCLDIYKINQHDTLTKWRIKILWSSQYIYSWLKKTLNIEGIYFHTTKAIYDKAMANILLNDEKMKASPLRSGTRQGCLPLPLLFNMVLEVFVIQSLNHVWLFATLWTAAHQASLSFTISWSLLKLVFTESVMPSNHLILCRPLLLLLNLP